MPSRANSARRANRFRAAKTPEAARDSELGGDSPTTTFSLADSGQDVADADAGATCPGPAEQRYPRCPYAAQKTSPLRASISGDDGSASARERCAAAERARHRLESQTPTMGGRDRGRSLSRSRAPHERPVNEPGPMQRDDEIELGSLPARGGEGAIDEPEQRFSA